MLVRSRADRLVRGSGGAAVIGLRCLLIFIILHGGIVSEGYAPHYQRNLMQQVARNRNMQPQACMVSSAQYKIGEWVWVLGKKTGVLLHCQIVDVSETRHRKGHLERKRLIELSWEVTRQLCPTIRGSSAECPVLTVRL